MKTAGTIQGLPGGFENVVSRIVAKPKKPHTAKSLLRYPGGKFRAVETIRSYIPKDTKKIVAPFLGGGSIELACAADGIKVYGADAYEPLINFWKQAKDNPVLLSERVRKYHPLTKPKFYNLQKGFSNLYNPLERAAVFYVLNRSSFSGTTLSGGMSPGHPRFTESSIDRLRDFQAKNLSVRCADFTQTIQKHSDKLMYLDPPYANGERLYGDHGDMHEGFNHKELAEQLHERDGWILSYNDCEQVRHLYDGYDFITPSWQYGMSSDKRSSEVLIVNI